MFEFVMPVSDQVRDDGSGIQNILKSQDSGFRRNDALKEFQILYETVYINARSCLISDANVAAHDIQYSRFSRVASPVVDFAGLNSVDLKKTSKYTAGCVINDSPWQ